MEALPERDCCDWKVEGLFDWAGIMSSAGLTADCRQTPGSGNFKLRRARVLNCIARSLDWVVGPDQAKR